METHPDTLRQPRTTRSRSPPPPGTCLCLCPKPCHEFSALSGGERRRCDGVCQRGAKSKVPWRKRPEEKCLNQEAGGAGAVAGRYLQAVSHRSHLPGGAAFPWGFHLFLLADSERRGQKGSVKTPQPWTPPHLLHGVTPLPWGQKAFGKAGPARPPGLAKKRPCLGRGLSLIHQVALPAVPTSRCQVCSPHTTTFTVQSSRGGAIQIYATGVHRPAPFTEALCWVSQ